MRIAKWGRDEDQTGRVFSSLSPSPGTPGEGGGEGDLGCRTLLVFEITLSLSRSTGRGDQMRAEPESCGPCSDVKGGVIRRHIVLLEVINQKPDVARLDRRSFAKS
jgi:hypothetical protein